MFSAIDLPDLLDIHAEIISARFGSEKIGTKLRAFRFVVIYQIIQQLSSCLVDLLKLKVQ